MYCPKCSQQQASEEIRFCSRCGFQLGVVKALLVNETLTSDTAESVAKNSISKRDMTLGAVLMFFVALIVAALSTGMPPFHSARITALIVLGLVLAFLINLKPLFGYFLKGDSPIRKLSPPAEQNNLASGDRFPTALGQGYPADAFQAPVHVTADMVRPASVVEETTNLLKRNDID
ncbi:MAG: hypothetical protein WKF34_13875 [Pyrinomonadaceae bacterium]